MATQSDRETLEQLIASARRKIFLREAILGGLKSTLVIFPIAGLLIALSQGWADGAWNGLLALLAFASILGFAAFNGLAGLGARLNSALAIDEKARLKDRVASAYEFLDHEHIDEPRALQIRDAIRHAQGLNFQGVFRIQWPRQAAWIPGAVLVFILGFFVPPLLQPQKVSAAIDEVKILQLAELDDLQEQLQFGEVPEEELKEVLEKLKQIQERFEKDELTARDVMLELARLDEALKEKASELGVENLEGELNTIVPHLMSASAAKAVASALKENQFDQAAEELKALSEQVKENKLTEEKRRELAMNMGVCASKLGKNKNASFGGSLAQASEALENSDGQEFESACESIGDKLGLLQKAKMMKLACKKIGNCKGGLGQCASKVGGYKLGPKSQSDKKGGLMAGTGASGNPLGEGSRLADSYRNLLRIEGQAGDGPVQTELEITDGQLSQSQVNLKELHADYAAVAEEAIENESIPLSHRYHVKRYFQSIRPQE